MDISKVNKAVKIRIMLFRVLKPKTRLRLERALRRLTDLFSGYEFNEYIKRVK